MRPYVLHFRFCGMRIMIDMKVLRALNISALVIMIVQTVFCIAVWLMQEPILPYFGFSEGADLSGTAPVLISPLLRAAAGTVLYLLIASESRKTPDTKPNVYPLAAALAAPIVLSAVLTAADRIFILYLSRTGGAASVARVSVLSQFMSYSAIPGMFIWLGFAAAAGMLYCRRNINQSV